MGVTESTLREPEGGQQHHYHHQQQQQQRPTPTSFKSLPRPPPKPLPPPIQTSFPTTRTRNAPHPHNNQSKQTRQSPHHNSPTPRTRIKLLKGIVCGAPNVGKSCLIQRLRGEDVGILQRNNDANANAGISAAANGGVRMIPAAAAAAAAKKNKRRMMALIPWTCDFHRLTVPLEESPRGIQLHVAERNDDHGHENGNANGRKQRRDANANVDFVILIIDRTRRETLEYASKWIDDHVLEQQKQQQSQEASTSSQPPSSSLPSICILLNHYDTIQSSSPSSTDTTTNTSNKDHPGENEANENGISNNNGDGDSTRTRTRTRTVTMKEVQEMMEEKGKSVTSSQPQPQSSSPYLQIRCFDSCMMNGYGLEALNSFMTIPYLKKREKELVLELERIKHSLEGWDDQYQHQLDQNEFVTFEDIQEQLLKQEAMTMAARSSPASTLDNMNKEEGSQRDEDVVVNKESRNNLQPGRGRRQILPTSGDMIVQDKAGMNKDKDHQSSSCSSSDSSEGMSSKHTINSAQQQVREGRRRRRRRGKANDEWKEAIRPSSSSPSIQEMAIGARKKKKKKKVKQQQKQRAQQKAKPVVRYVDPKQALEAFLASDDDDDDDSRANDNDEGGATLTTSTSPYPSYAGGMAMSHYTVSRNAAVLDSDSDDSTDDNSVGPVRDIRVHNAKATFQRVDEPETSTRDKEPEGEVPNLEKSAIRGNEVDADAVTEADTIAQVVPEKVEEESSTDLSQLVDHSEPEAPFGEGQEIPASDLEEHSVHSEESKEEEIRETKYLNPKESEDFSNGEESNGIDENEKISQKGITSQEDFVHSEESKEVEILETNHQNPKESEESSLGEESNCNEGEELLNNDAESVGSKTHTNETCGSKAQESKIDIESDAMSLSMTENQDGRELETDRSNANLLVGAIKINSIPSNFECNAAESGNVLVRKETNACPREENNDPNVGSKLRSDDSSEEERIDDANNEGKATSIPSELASKSEESKKDDVERKLNIRCGEEEFGPNTHNSSEKDEVKNAKDYPVKISNMSDVVEQNEAEVSVHGSDSSCQRHHLSEKEIDGDVNSDKIDQVSEGAETGDDATKSVPLNNVAGIEISDDSGNISSKGTKSHVLESVEVSDCDSDDSSGMIIVDAPKQASTLQPLNRTVLKRTRVKEVEKETFERKDLSEEKSQPQSTISKEVLDAIAMAEKEAVSLLSKQQKKSKKVKKKSGKKDKKSASDKKRKKKHT